jgi:hypothetical protein
LKAERWKQIDDIFQAAIARGPAERSAFLDGASASDPSPVSYTQQTLPTT